MARHRKTNGIPGQGLLPLAAPADVLAPVSAPAPADAPASVGPSAPAPVFGVQARWLCCREGIADDYGDRESGGTLPLANPESYARVGILYMLVGDGHEYRLQAPALGLDLHGGTFDAVWQPFIAAANAAALEAGIPARVIRTEKGLHCPDQRVTTSWRGETRAIITNTPLSRKEQAL